MAERVVYLKGGRAIEEAQALYPRLGELPDGGPDKFLLAVMFYTRGAQLRLCSFGPRNQRTRVMGREVNEYAARADVANKFRRRLAFVGALLAFIWDTVSLRPQRVLCGVDGPFALAAWLSARLTGAQFVFLAHSALALPTTSRPYKLANTWLCRRADRVIAHGPFVRDEAIGLGAQPGRVIEFNNGLDPEHKALLDALPPKATAAKDAYILYVGRVEEDKGVVDLLDAFRQLRGHPQTRLIYVGNGSANDTLRRLIAQYGLADRVQVLGPVPFGAVFGRLSGASVVVTPSQSKFPEGFCKAAMEAFYVGTPVIAPDYGPFPYMVRHEVNGLLYTADDVSSLASALQRYFDDAGLQQQLALGAAQAGEVFMNPAVPFRRAIEAVFIG